MIVLKGSCTLKLHVGGPCHPSELRVQSFSLWVKRLRDFLPVGPTSLSRWVPLAVQSRRRGATREACQKTRDLIRSHWPTLLVGIGGVVALSVLQYGGFIWCSARENCPPVGR